MNQPGKNVDRWLLPDGIGDVLPEQALQIEDLRRQLLDLYNRWGYLLVIPPLLEFTESLLIGTNKDIDLQTFKVTDQLSGRTMGIRADITPQTARIDAHSLNRNGPVRLCYAGSVLHTRPATALASRSPIQVGAEYFGVSGLSADIEVISLMLETLTCVNVTAPTLSIGHVNIFRSLIDSTELNSEQQETLLDILQRKAKKELDDFLANEACDKVTANLLEQLSRLNGGANCLADAQQRLKDAPEPVLAAIGELEQVANAITQRFPSVTIHFDLAELPGYHYHTGIVFAAYANGSGAAIANGGRYDAVGEVFGRARAATGFNTDLKTLIQLGQCDGTASFAPGILACIDNSPEQWAEIRAQRAAGEQVICVDPQEPYDISELHCDRELVCEQGSYQVKPLNT